MKIVLATPLYPPEIGGPATYAKGLEEGLVARGDTVSLVLFSGVRRYPKALRHLMYFWRVCRALRGADVLVAFDTWSTGVPALLAARLRGKKTLVRIGGDFLWETYLGRTAKPIKLSEFYTENRSFALKERLIYRGAHWVTRHADALVFNTEWQRDIWEREYGFDPRKATVIENVFPADRQTAPAKGRVFVAAGRSHVIKNLERLERAFAEVKRSFPDIELDTRALSPSEHAARIRDAYAVVIPSVSEVNPNTAIDAIRWGKPFILPLDTGARERLAGVGVFVDTLDEAALQQALEKLLDPEAYEQACERVHAFSFSHSWEEVVQEFSTILHTLCAS